MIGPPCAVCGKPSSASILTAVGAAPGLGIGQTGPTQYEPRCNEHNPYVVKCKRGHYQWGGNYCTDCGAPLRESLETRQ
jgi:hypothetical protein